MEELLQWMEYIEDVRQERKVRHLLKDILVIVLFATLANADDWVEIALFAQVYEEYLKKYIELRNGPPSYVSNVKSGSPCLNATSTRRFSIIHAPFGSEIASHN